MFTHLIIRFLNYHKKFETLKFLSRNNGVLSPYVKNNTPLKETPHFVAFNYDSLVCRFIKSTAGAIFSNIVHPCPHFLHLHILIQVLPPETLFL